MATMDEFLKKLKEYLFELPEDEKDSKDEPEKEHKVELPAIDKKEEVSKVVNVEADVNKEAEKKEVNVVEPIFKDGWFDPVTLQPNDSKITSKEVARAIKEYYDAIIKNNNSVMIEKEVTEHISKANAAVSDDILKRSLDLSAVKVEGGKVVGVKEAFDKLKEVAPAMFKSETSPVHELLNPVKQVTDDVSSMTFLDAINLDQNNK